MMTLGLTTYRSKSSKKFGGYNFAFKMDGADAENPDGKYGKECVVFQSSGVEGYHGGDEEDQVIFWGKSITTQPIPIIAGSSKAWEVWSMMNNRAVFSTDSIEDAFAWVRKHYRQYQRAFNP